MPSFSIYSLKITCLQHPSIQDFKLNWVFISIITKSMTLHLQCNGLFGISSSISIYKTLFISFVSNKHLRCNTTALDAPTGTRIHSTTSHGNKVKVSTFVINLIPLIFFIYDRFTPFIDLLRKVGAEYSHFVTKEAETEKLMSVWEMCNNDKEYTALLGYKVPPLPLPLLLPIISFPRHLGTLTSLLFWLLYFPVSLTFWPSGLLKTTSNTPFV
jgi:hypothetical protein